LGNSIPPSVTFKHRNGLAHFVSATMPMSSPAAQLAEFKRRVFGVRSEVLAVLQPSGTTSIARGAARTGRMLEGWPVLV
jgi:hypothetical protein